MDTFKIDCIRRCIAALREDEAYWKNESLCCRHLDMMESGKYLNASRKCGEEADTLERSIHQPKTVSK